MPSSVPMPSTTRPRRHRSRPCRCCGSRRRACSRRGSGRGHGRGPIHGCGRGCGGLGLGRRRGCGLSCRGPSSDGRGSDRLCYGRRCCCDRCERCVVVVIVLV